MHCKLQLASPISRQSILRSPGLKSWGWVLSRNAQLLMRLGKINLNLATPTSWNTGERLRQLKYEFINGNASQSAATALRFALSVPGVHVAIVGTTKPGRWKENADLLSKGLLSDAEFEAIRAKWKEVAADDWVGQT